MHGSTRMKLLIITLIVALCSAKPDSRSYQISPIPVINGVQGVQYVPMAAIYSEIPTVLVPKPIGMDVMALHSTGAAAVTLPPQNLIHQKYYEPTGSSELPSEPVLQPVKAPLYSIRGKTKIPVYAMKRPAYYNFGRKKIAVHPYQNQKVSSISIEPSIDLSDQLQQLQGTYPSTTPAPASTYGPAKVLDHSLTHVSTYIRPKGHHPHPHYHPKDYRVYSHMHKGHIHNHHIPPGYALHKSQYHSSAKPSYPILKPTVATYASGFHPEQSFNYHAYARPETFSTNHIRFPDSELKKSLLNAYKQHQEEILQSTRFEHPKTHADITQALVKEPGTIQNYDASIPIKIPSKKPNKFEVKEILRNADVHFIDGDQGEYQPQRYVQYTPLGFDASKVAAYQALTLGHVTKDAALVPGYGNGISHNHIDYYDQRDAATANQPVAPEELSTSETIKVPVAVIKGAQVGSTVKGGFPLKVARIEQTNAEKPKQKAFTPSSTNSDWIPMSGKPLVPPIASSSSLTSSSSSSSSTSSDASKSTDKYFADILNKRKEDSEPTRIITSNRNIGDIISGKIPGEYSPQFAQPGLRSIQTGGDIITGKIAFGQDSETDRRKGSVLTVNHPSTSDTSNLVVSSMIKFS